MNRLLVAAVSLLVLPVGLALAQPGGGPQVRFKVVTVVEGLQNPWSMAWLPNGDMLVTERGGTIRTIRNGQLLPEPMANVPAVRASGQGGLFDIVLHPDYAENGWVYISFAKPDANNQEATTTVIRAKIRNNALVDIEEIFEADAWINSAGHYGGRIAFDGQGHIFISSGERMDPTNIPDLTKHKGQTTNEHFGVIIRLNDDGSLPRDNPFVGREGFAPEMWSYGHRNPQGLVYDTATGTLWETEHGPQGGDELNVIQPGKNYGWPVITYGANYGSGTEIGARAAPGMEQPAAFYVPSIAPSGLMLYTGDVFPDWRGRLFVGGLSAAYGGISVVSVNGTTVSGRTPILAGYRVRDIRQGPDGFIYVAVDSSTTTTKTPIIRLEPEAAQ